MVRVGINGFGRIGRHIVRAAVELQHQDVEIVAINDLGSLEAAVHLLRYDSVHGRLNQPVHVRHEGEFPQIDFGFGWVRVTSDPRPEQLPWADLGVDVVLECTGRFTKRDAAARHLGNGSKKVLVSAPCQGADATVVFGVNHNILTPEHQVISNASCTTNCLAPMADVLHRSVGILKGYMTTVHAFTGDQHTVDTTRDDLYRARGASLSLIPTSTGAAKAIGLVVPDLKGRLNGSAVRAPIPDVSMVDLTFIAQQNTTAEQINEAMQEAAAGSLSGVIGIYPEPLVSSDFIHCPHSCAFAPAQTSVTEDDFVRVVAWYDNEWAFSLRMLDVAAVVGSLS